MRFIKFSMLSILCIFISEMTFALPIDKSNPGVVFVHGTKDHREDASTEYWKTDFVSKVTSGLKNADNYYIVHCDFSQYFWHENAANCASKQIIDFIEAKNISSLTIITHSNGGNVIRWILSNPTYNSSFQTIRQKTEQVIALAPSSGGSPLADEILDGGYLETNLAWLIDYLSDAVKQQRVGDMAIFNNQLLFGSKDRPALPVPFKVVVGTDVLGNPLDSHTYCNGISETAALKITKMYLDNCSDGFLNCSSQTAAGEVWFYDKSKTLNQEPLSHNQTRHACAGLDNILREALIVEGDPV